MLVTVFVKWNEALQAVEVSHIHSDSLEHSDIGFLNLKPSIKYFLDLTYTEDGYVLSGQGKITSLEEWMSLVSKQIEYHFHLPWLDTGFEVSFMPTEDFGHTRIYPNEDFTDWGIRFEFGFGAFRLFKGFQTYLQAERFAQRLWLRAKGLYYICCADDSQLQDLWRMYNLRSGDYDIAENTFKRLLVTSGKGDMRWSISTTNGMDSIYFDYYDLPNGFWQIYSVIDCGTGQFYDDFDVDIVAGSGLKSGLVNLIESAVNWFSSGSIEYSESDMEDIRKQAETLMETLGNIKEVT